MTLLRRLCLVFAVLMMPKLGGASEIVAARLTGPGVQREWRYLVYLPTGYHTSQRRYPVVYLLHGWASDEASWITKAGVAGTADNMIAHRMMAPCILVMPAAGFGWYLHDVGQAENDFVSELLPEIDHTWRTLPDRRSRMIAGLSMGGYGALRLALRFPDRFSAVALMSPAIYSPLPPDNSAARLAPAFQSASGFDADRWRQLNYPSLLDEYAHSLYHLRVQLSAGRQDRLHTDIAAEAFVTAWRARGWQADVETYPGGHNFAFWRATLPLMLQFLVGPEPSTQIAERRSRPPAR